MVVYTPKRGDIVWLDFNPQKGSEQRGHRPALVLSVEAYNQLTSLALFIPITSKIKGYPFEVLLRDTKTKGAILSDQIKSLDYKARNIAYVESIEKELLDEVLQKIRILID